MSYLKSSRRGFTLIELLVVVAIISLLVTLLMPALKQIKDAAKTVYCARNLYTLGVTMQTYMTENNQKLPMATIIYPGDTAPPENKEIPPWYMYFKRELGLKREGTICPSVSTRNTKFDRHTWWASPTWSDDLLAPIGHIPAAHKWEDEEWIEDSGIDVGGGVDYGINGLYANLNDKNHYTDPPEWGSAADMKRPARIMAFAGAGNTYLGGWPPFSGPLFRHRMDTAINVVMFDNHVETVDMYDSRNPPMHIIALDPAGYGEYPWMDPPPQ